MTTSLLLPRDLARLQGVHPDLVKVVTLARSRASFIVLEGLRTPERQAQLLAEGKSRTLRSRHLTGHAVDLAPWKDADADRVVDAGEIDWNDWQAFRDLSKVMLTAAVECGVDMVWGGNWPTLKDGPHYELSSIRYPAP